MIRSAVIGLVFAGLLTGCATDETVAAYGGAGQVWRVVELDGTPFSAQATLTFPERGVIAGMAPCNRYTAQMDTPYPWFEAGPVSATKLHCPAHQSETIFFAALSAMTLVEVLGDTLILSTPEGRSIILKSGD